MTIPTSEWMETDGLGGFASGTSTGPERAATTALLLAATTPPTGRVMLVNGLEAWIETPAGRYAISSPRYAPDVVHPVGIERLATSATTPGRAGRIGSRTARSSNTSWSSSTGK